MVGLQVRSSDSYPTTFESHWTRCHNTWCFSPPTRGRWFLAVVTGPAKPLRAGILSVFLFYVSFGTGVVQALDPNKHLTQYMHTSWRVQNGSAPDGIEAITQTLDGYLWLSSGARGMYRFDGVRFVPWTVSSNGKTIHAIVNMYGDHGGGLWAFSEREIVHLKDDVVASHFDLDGLQQFQQISEDPDGSVWVVRGGAAGSDAPLCRISDRALKCFGKSDGVLISPADSLLADGNGGFWLGGILESHPEKS